MNAVHKKEMLLKEITQHVCVCVCVCARVRAWRLNLRVHFVLNVSLLRPSDFHSVNNILCCATSWKVVGSNPDEVIEFFIDLILPATLWPRV
jgi:hypothetical protein